MKIKEMFGGTAPIYSFEFFPPKDAEGFEKLFETIDHLKKWVPAFVSVTYGAGGSTRSQTLNLVGRIKNEIGLESMAHLTCVGSNIDEILSVLDSLQSKGIENILALRGDPPKGEERFVRPENGFGYADELVAFIRKHYSFCVGVAGYPEGHIESPDLTIDLENMKRKIDAGSDFVVTQLFFDNRHYFDFIERARVAGISIPIIPGIMPVLNAVQIKRFTKMCGATIPDDFKAQLESHQDDSTAVRKIGIEHATEQCENLLLNGAPGIHFYTLNRSTATLNILENIKNKVRSS